MPGGKPPTPTSSWRGYSIDNGQPYLLLLPMRLHTGGAEKCFSCQDVRWKMTTFQTPFLQVVRTYLAAETPAGVSGKR